MRLLVRSWNIFHGRTLPAGRDDHVEEMVRLVAPGADVVCLQEVPVWALGELEAWSGMRAFGITTMPAPGGRFARRLTAAHPQRLRSALTGQANAVLVARTLGVPDGPVRLPLNPRRFRRRQARHHGLPLGVRLLWARDRRVGQLVRLERDGQSVVLANAHLSTSHDARPADAELLRLATYAEGYARPGEPIVLAGDLNLTRTSSAALPELERWGFSAAGPGIDHILARGLAFEHPPAPWPRERRRRGALLLSDHAPVEAAMMAP